jgi:hypothetical protein
MENQRINYTYQNLCTRDVLLRSRREAQERFYQNNNNNIQINQGVNRNLIHELNESNNIPRIQRVRRNLITELNKSNNKIA